MNLNKCISDGIISMTQTWNILHIWIYITELALGKLWRRHTMLTLIVVLCFGLVVMFIDCGLSIGLKYKVQNSFIYIKIYIYESFSVVLCISIIIHTLISLSRLSKRCARIFFDILGVTSWSYYDHIR